MMAKFYIPKGVRIGCLESIEFEYLPRQRFKSDKANLSREFELQLWPSASRQPGCTADAVSGSKKAIRVTGGPDPYMYLFDLWGEAHSTASFQ
jgi:hypothetical protein